jgi:hypothetical protein
LNDGAKIEYFGECKEENWYNAYISYENWTRELGYFEIQELLFKLKKLCQEGM